MADERTAFAGFDLYEHALMAGAALVVILTVGWNYLSYSADLECKRLGFADGGWHFGTTYCRTYHHLDGPARRR